MALQRGTRLGVYDVVDQIGAGGMGEVFRARDTRLGRDVALKVLPDRVSADRDRTSRLEREARALAALNHSNIAAIYGLEDLAAAQPGEAPGIALVMEFVDGETLADRLARGPLAREDALAIASQIADALEAAHERGIVHRDLKPANVKITSGGVVKVLDFGLAKVLAEASDDDATLTATKAGTIVGTPAYMAPEQAQGKPADQRADIWAFGAVLYEMLAGTRPFRGESAHDTIAAVLTATPEWDRVPTDLQPVVRACLARDPRQRLRHIGDYRWLLGSAPPLPAVDRRSSRRWMPWVAGVALVAGALGAEAWRALAPPPEMGGDQLIRLTTTLPAGVTVWRGPSYNAPVTVSPDGRTVVVVGSDKDGQRLYRRSLDRVEATPIAGSERATCPFFSWDGAWIGFFADGRLKRIPSTGGAAVDIVAIATRGFPSGASWGSDNRIVFGYNMAGRWALYSVDSQGGPAEPIAGIQSGFSPEVLPDGKTILYESNGWVHVIERTTGRSTRLIEGRSPRFARGHVVLNRGTTLLAAPLDLSRLVLGAVVLVAEGVAAELPGSGSGRLYAISNTGTLVYLPAATSYALVIVSPDSSERTLGPEQRSFENPQFSPDGRRVVVAATRRDEESPDLWLYDVASGTPSRLTFDGGRTPVWKDDTLVTFSRLNDARGIYTKRADGRGEASLFLPLPTFHWLVGWTPARTLGYVFFESGGSSIMAFANNQSQRVVGPGSVWGGRLSPDGKWLVYYVLASGTFEVYVTPFPDGGTRWLIAEGIDPNWSPVEPEIFYRSGARLMAARIDRTGGGFRVLSHRVVYEPFQPPLYDDYHMRQDGTLVLVRPANRVHGREVNLVIGWASELDRLRSGS
jgi:serine/threonine-protein kinase